MQLIHNRLLDANGITSPGQKYFIFRYLELLNKATVDTFRFRAMNSKSILHELLEVLGYVEQGIWDATNIKMVCEEALGIIKNDPILKDAQYIDALKKALENGVTRAGSPGEQKIMKVILEGLLGDLDKYLPRLIEGIRISISDNDLVAVEWYTSTFVTELINSGHDQEFLYQVGIRALGRQIRDFNDLFNHLVQTVKPEKKSYTTYIKIKGNHPNLNERVLNHEFLNSLEIESTEPQVIDFITSENPKLFAVRQTEAVDPNAAAFIARSEIGYLLDILHYSNPKGTVSIDSNCLVRHNKQFGIHSSTPELTGYVPDQNWFPKVTEQLSNILDLNKLDSESKDKLKGSLRYFRLSNEAVSIEQRFLNLWIALEHLVRSGVRHKSIIEPISDFLPKTLALNYIHRLGRDAIDNVKRLKIHLPVEIEYLFKTRNVPEFIQLCRDETKLYALLDAVSQNPLLEFRLRQFSHIVKGSNTIKAAIDKNYRDIDHHLVRIYRIRNRIVHSAGHDLNIWSITANLHYYVRTVLNILLFELSNYDCFPDLWSVYIKYQTAFNQYLSSLNKNSTIAYQATVVDNPLRILWP